MFNFAYDNQGVCENPWFVLVKSSLVFVLVEGCLLAALSLCSHIKVLPIRHR